ncbi:hypothetical protein N7493_006063 [Penicillium malachiteum]|uniref:HNH nuclease domain-containing protein n=1 Tax=Penicillium malachiteum TaxID=1324776 RepID=A0AAD6HME8_9EURO|nr:hypothetical protein N7493_006063 [Penicillium malachiteum]
MPKRKHESHSPSPRVLTLRASTLRQHYQRSAPQGGVGTEPSGGQTAAEGPDDQWEKLKARAHERLSQFRVTEECEKLQDCFTALLNWLPEGGRDAIAHDILGSKSDKKLTADFERICTRLLFPMKFCGRKRCEYTKDKHEPLDEDLAEYESGIHQECLRRDGNRCVVTKTTSKGDSQIVLEPAYIIPWSFPSHNPPKDTGCISKMWTTLYRCFPAIESVLSSRINEVENSLTLLNSINREFGEFRCALESIPDTPHTYKFVTFKDFPLELKSSLSGQVKFKDTDQPTSQAGLPHPVLLDCHYRLAKIFYESGMIDVIDEDIRDLEELIAGHELDLDGDTDLGSVVEYAIWGSMTA